MSDGEECPVSMTSADAPTHFGTDFTGIVSSRAGCAQRKAASSPRFTAAPASNGLLLETSFKRRPEDTFRVSFEENSI